MPNALEKIRKRASAMIKENPRIKYQQALKKAGREYREGQVGKAPKKKIGAKARKARYVPVKAQHCKRIGAVADKTLAQSMAETKKKLVARLGWAMVNRDRATTAASYHRYDDEVRNLRKKINALS